MHLCVTATGDQSTAELRDSEFLRTLAPSVRMETVFPEGAAMNNRNLASAPCSPESSSPLCTVRGG